MENLGRLPSDITLGGIIEISAKIHGEGRNDYCAEWGRESVGHL